MTFEIGDQIGVYRVEERLGGGGMGVVLKARDTSLERDVAIKGIKPELAGDPAFNRRFEREARLLGSLNSPHIVTIHSLQRVSGAEFIVMEYVDGGDLSKVLDDAPLPVQRTLRIAEQVLAGLRDAHEVGVIHRDIKPKNILISSTGAIKIADFGLGRMSRQDRDSTLTQAAAGTLVYMAPEQIRGETLDKRCDLWAMGIILFEMLVGERPFAGSYAEVVDGVLTKPVSIPPRIREGLPDGLPEIVERALEKDRGKRYSEAGEMLVSIDRLSRRQPSSGSRAFVRTGSGVRWHASVLVAFLAVIVFALVYDQIKGGSAPTEVTSAPERFLSVTTIPSGAEVLLGGQLLGLTPLKAPVDSTEDALVVEIRKSGYVSIDTALLAGPAHTFSLAESIPVTRPAQERGVRFFSLEPFDEGLAKSIEELSNFDHSGDARTNQIKLLPNGSTRETSTGLYVFSGGSLEVLKDGRECQRLPEFTISRTLESGNPLAAVEQAIERRLREIVENNRLDIAAAIVRCLG